MPGLGSFGPVEMFLVLVFGAIFWLLPIAAAVLLVVALWRVMRAQEATAATRRDIADTLRRQGP